MVLGILLSGQESVGRSTSMVYRVLPLFLLALALAVVGGAPLVADDKADKNTHEGTFLSATSAKEFTMEDKDKKKHSHTLADDAKLTGPDGKECKLTDFVKGQRIRVTTKEGDPKTATKVEAIRRKE